LELVVLAEQALGLTEVILFLVLLRQLVAVAVSEKPAHRHHLAALEVVIHI
jgi:hypothetical protein